MATYQGGAEISKPDVGPFTADDVFQPRRNQWEMEPNPEHHIVASDPVRPPAVAPTEG